MSSSGKQSSFIVAAMLLGLLMTSLDNTIVSASMNNVIKDLSGFQTMSWVFTSYALASTSTMLVFGKMSDLFGRKLFYLIGIAAFLVGSALCGVAQSMNQLIAFRALQGIGSGAIFPISFTIIYMVFDDPKQAMKMSGIFAGVFGLASVAGPQLGTWISSSLGWRWCFYVNVPLGVLSFIILLLTLKESRAEKRPNIDYAGTLLLVVSTVSIMLALTWGGSQYKWTDWQMIGLFALALLSSLAFIQVERKAAEPILPLHLFRNRIVSGTSIISFCQGAILFSTIAYIPIFTVAVLQQANTNNALTPMMLCVMLGAVLFGFLLTLFSYRLLMGTSMLMAVIATYLLSRAGIHSSVGYLIGLMVMLGLLGIGPMMSLAQNAIAANVDVKYIGISSSLVGFSRNIGGVLGASITATLVNNNLKQRLVDGAAAHHIPIDQIDRLANPQLLVKASSQVPAQLVDFLRESLGAAINHGYLLSIAAAIVGLGTALLIGPGRFQKKSAAADVQTAAAEG